jgi:hypothetical protein
MGKPDGKTILVSNRKYVDNIKMDLMESVRSGIGLIDLAQYRDKRSEFENTIINMRIPRNMVKILSNWEIGGFSNSSLELVIINALKLTCVNRDWH